jgi:hypothetical protein
MVETMGANRAERYAIYELQCELADAHRNGAVWTFKRMHQMINEETLALARSLPPPSAFQIGRWHSVDNEQLTRQLHEQLVAAKETMTQRALSTPLQSIQGDPLFDKIRDGISLDHAGQVYRQVERLLTGAPLEEEDYLGYDLAWYVRNAGVTKRELEKLLEDIQHRRWDAIPIVFIYANLCAQIEVDFRRRGTPKAYNVNDELDVPRMAVGLEAAEMIITDRGMAHVCRTVGPRCCSEAVAFSLNKADDAVAFLRSRGVK